MLAGENCGIDRQGQGRRDGLTDKAKDAAGDAVVKAAQTAGPVWDKTKDVAGDAVLKAAQTAGPAMEKTKAVAGSVTFVLAGTVGELKDKLFGTQNPPASTSDSDD